MCGIFISSKTEDSYDFKSVSSLLKEEAQIQALSNPLIILLAYIQDYQSRIQMKEGHSHCLMSPINIQYSLMEKFTTT